MLVFRLAVRALAWRAAASATVFVVALVGIIAAAVGPIYLHAVDETVLAERLLAAPQVQRDIHVTRDTAIGTTEVDFPGPLRAMAARAADRRWFDPPVYAEEAQIYVRGTIRYASQLAAIDDICRHVTLVTGRCVADGSTGEVMISARTATGLHLSVGDVVKPLPIANVVPIPLRIVGVVNPIAVHGSFWETWDFFNQTPAIFDGQLPRLDSFFVSHAALSTRTHDVEQTIAADVHLVPSKVHLDGLPALRAHVRSVQDAAAGLVNRQGPTDVMVGSQLADVLNGMNREMSLARTLIVLPTVQLVLLAIFILYAVVAGTTAVQGPEVALAKLRGRRGGSVLLQGVLQPIMLILVAAPVASLLAWLVIRLVAGHLLATSVHVAFPASAVEVVIVAAAGGMLAATIAARRIVISPVGALLRRGTDASGSSVGLALADAAAVTLALAGLVELIAGGVLNSGKTDPLSALAPTLLGIAAAIVVLRLLPFAGRLLVRWTRDSRRVATFLAVRQIVRRPAGARVLVLVGVALALATFAVTNWSVARTNREVRALNETGADTVLSVRPGPDVYDLRRAVDRADPSGRSMAAAVVQADRSTPLIAVDTTRFAGVGAWRPGYTATPLRQALATLRAQRPASISFTGTALALDVTLTRSPTTSVDLTIYVTGIDHRRDAYDLGKIRPGPHTYVTALPPVCGQGCRITGLVLQPGNLVRTSNNVSHPPTIQATVAARSLTAGRWQPVAGFGQAARWRADGPADAQIDDAATALRLVLQQSTVGNPWPELVSADVPSHVPAVVASGTAGAYPGPSIHDASSFGLDEVSLPIDGKITAVTLPEADRFGAMVDFGVALDAMSEPPGGATHFQVWLAADAPHDMVARLQAQGVVVTATARAATARRVLDRSGPAFADGLFLVAAGAATLLALGATVLGGIVTARRRAYELAALEAAGVAPRALRRATAGEQGILLGLGLLVGLGAGLGGAVLALPSTPFFVDESVGPPAEHGLPIGLVGALTAGLLAAFALTCLAVARFVSRQATAGRLREAQQ